MSKILEVTNLKKFFINKNHINKAVDDVSFDVSEGEILGLIGESGSGKTTVGRSLLRLYDDYNGFVRINGKLVSGKQISRKTNRFMRKNIQMIFQDPMASLNGQNNIFSILKEPLVVNRVIKNKISDIKKDWESVQYNFHYSFLEEALKLKLENLKIANSLNQPFYNKWNEYFNNFNLDAVEGSFEDKFNAYFAYLEEKSKNNSLIIDSLYKNTEKLISLYDQKKQQFRNEQIDLDEVELKQARAEYKKQKQLLWHTYEYFESKQNTFNAASELKKSLFSWREKYLDSKNSLNNFISELKNESKLLFNEAYGSPYIDYFAYKVKIYHLNNHIKKIFIKHKSKLRYLDFDELQQLINHLQDKSSEFFKHQLNANPFDFNKLSEFSKTIKNIVVSNFNFDLSDYLKQSKYIQDQYRSDAKSKWKTFVKSLKTTIKGFFVKPKINKDAFNQAKQRLQQTQENFDKELQTYMDSYKLRVLELKKQVQEQEDISKSFIAIDKGLIGKFNQIHKQFLAYFKANYIDKTKQQLINKKDDVHLHNKLKATLKQYKVDYKVFISNVYDKLNGIKSFEIESRYLNKDLKAIYLFLGISNYDIFLQNKFYKKPINFITKFWRIHKISSLLTRNTIYKSLEDVGLLKQFAYRYPHEFSGGQRQRIVIARALITEPKIIVADEPIASLDISIQAQIVNLLKDLCKQKNIGMIFIAHDLSMIEYIADRVLIMHLGKIVESGHTNAIYQNPIHPYTINLFKAIPKISNANEKFKDVKFELSYMDEQKYPNLPKNQDISENEQTHYVYATDEQILKWSK
ncbi:ATP-binding cassette domain-containing protein [Mycoplasma sp. 6243]|uniref:ATP-binding cassette domain-containing protein n=1 Tax=Mycoplasma sp. 6243 TaxID=3440865 RepID=UPI003EB9DA68